MGYKPIPPGVAPIAIVPAIKQANMALIEIDSISGTERAVSHSMTI